MTFPASEEAALPAAVAGLVREFERVHPGAELRVWRGLAAGARQLYPEADARDARSRPGRGAVPVPGGDGLAVEALGTAVPPEAVTFLAHAFARLIAYEREARSAARELSERYEEINLLYSISEILGSILSLEVASRRILQEVADVMGARRASLWVHDEPQQRLFLAAAVGQEGLAGPIPLSDTRSVTARVFRERQPLSLDRPVQLPEGARLEHRPRAHEPYLSVPMNYTPPDGEPRTVGVITLVGGRAGAPFSAGDVRLLSAVASQVGAALETHRLVRESLRRERLVRELELAHDLQLKLLPDTADFEVAGDVAARCMPADSVGGDFYHLFRLADRRLGVMIGDVSGHGFSAALIMALAISAAAIYAQDAGPPGDVLRRVHDALIDELESTEMYLTVFYGVLDPAAGQIVYSSAGHPHAFRFPARGEPVRLGATNPPLGTLQLDRYDEATAPWRAGEDLLCLFTDGLSGAFAAAGATAEGGAPGETRLLEFIGRLRAKPAATIVDRLFAHLPAGPLAGPPDDRAAVLVRV